MSVTPVDINQQQQELARQEAFLETHQPNWTSDKKKLAQEMGLVNPETGHADDQIAPEVKALADDFITQLESWDATSLEGVELRAQMSASLETLGDPTMAKAATHSEMLNKTVGNLMTQADDGGPVATNLVNLRLEIDQLSPSLVNFAPNWFYNLIFKPIKKYAMRFQSTRGVIEGIIKSLVDGKKELENDSRILQNDQKGMRSLTIKLQMNLDLAMLIKQRLEDKLAGYQQGTEEYNYVGSELLFSLNQKIQDMQQQLLVNQQAVMTYEIIIRNNRELIRAIKSAQVITIPALTTAVVAALALAGQKKQLEKINKLKATTSDLILQTSEQLATTGVEVHKMATDPQVNIETLQKAFANINKAINDVTEYRVKALPVMRKNIEKMNSMAAEAERSISRMEKGTKASKPLMSLDVGELPVHQSA